MRDRAALQQALDGVEVVVHLAALVGVGQSPHNPYTGVVTLFAQRLRQGEAPILFEDGEQTRDFVHVADVVQANLLALEREQDGGVALNVGSGSAVTIRQLAGLVGRALGQETSPRIPGTYRPGDVRHSGADVTQARQVLGYGPRVGLAEGLAGTMEWLEEQ